MVSRDRRLRVAILGARGIGKIHARIFHALGADVCAVLGSTNITATAAVRDLDVDFGIKAVPYYELESFLSHPVDAISICTPPHLHFEQTVDAFNRGLPVFCEKPLFWHTNITFDEVTEQLDRLASHKHRQLFVNTSNASLIDSIRDRLPAMEDVHSFSFQFYTQGAYRSKDIAFDLLPHGLSLLRRILGPGEISRYTEEVTLNTYRSRFRYEWCSVDFDFQQGPEISKVFVLVVNGQAFMRIQETSGDTYRIYLHDNATEERIEVVDPFHTYIGRFLDFCKSDSPRKQDAFEEESANLRLMAQILLRGDSHI